MRAQRSRCLAVPKQEAESARRRLRQAGLLRGDLGPVKEGDTVYLPLLDGELAEEWRPALCERDFPVQACSRHNYRDLVRVPGELRGLLPRAFDVVGQVILIKLPPELEGYKGEIGRALLEARPDAVSVARDRGVRGEDRVRELEVIAGRPDLETCHMEYGLRFMVDPSRVYFSPRLATERRRVAGLVGKGERVIDLFAGVGPFSIHIAKRAHPAQVHAVDINPAAIGYLRQNIGLNRVQGVVPVLGDAAEMPGRLPPADRIIMNLPCTGRQFLPPALRMLAPEGTIHLYEVLERGALGRAPEELGALVRAEGRELVSADTRLVRGYSTLESHYVFDMRVE